MPPHLFSNSRKGQHVPRLVLLNVSNQIESDPLAELARLIGR